MVVSTGFAVLSPRSDLDARYLGWTAQSDVVIEEVVARSVGVSYPAINGLEIGDVAVPVPPIAVQRSIADHLDAETARIDRLSRRRTDLVERLGERRAATIVAGVAGTMLAARRKRSSLPWLADVPADWSEIKLTLIARLGSGHTPSRQHEEWWTECSIPWITTGEVWQLRDDKIEYLTDTRESISELGLAHSAAELCPAGTVVLSRTASAGFSAIMGTEMATSQDFMTWQCGPRLRPRYLLLCLRAMRADLLERLAMGSTHQTIYVPDTQSIRIPLPSVEEQDLIVDWTWQSLRHIDSVVEVIEQQVDLLGERRHALITAAVTGQIDIPGAAA